jgi:hypothetical protein
MKFRSHGTATFTDEGQLLLLDVVGPWNAELVNEIHSRAAAKMAAMSTHGKWGLVVLVSESILCSAEAAAAIREAARRESSIGKRAAVAFVASFSVEGRGLVEPVFYKIYEGIHPVAFFESLNEAKLWISPLLEN